MLRLVGLVMFALGSSLVVMPGASQPATGPSPQRGLLHDQRALLDQHALFDDQQTLPDDQRALLDEYCVSCHNENIVASAPVPGESIQRTQLRELGLTLDTEDVSNVAANPEVWEKVVRKLRVGMMPPPPRPRPDSAAYQDFRRWLETELDEAAARAVDPGRTQAFHRLNQTEYGNVVRDLLDLDIDVSELIPPDAPDRHGFDNTAEVLSLSPVLMERMSRRLTRCPYSRSARPLAVPPSRPTTCR